AFDLPGASMVWDDARRASSSASAAAVERTPEVPGPKPLMPEIEPLPEEPLVRMLGSDGIEGSDPGEWMPLELDLEEGLAPGLLPPPVRARILRSPSVGVNSLITLSTRESVMIFFALDKNAKYDSSMSSKSI